MIKNAIALIFVGLLFLTNASQGWCDESINSNGVTQTKVQEAFRSAVFSGKAMSDYFSLASPKTIHFFQENQHAKDSQSGNIEFEITSHRRQIMGVTTTAVIRRQHHSHGGTLSELLHWLAISEDGTVWCFGQNATYYIGEKVAYRHAWQADNTLQYPQIYLPSRQHYGVMFSTTSDTARFIKAELNPDRGFTVDLETLPDTIVLKRYDKQMEAIGTMYFARGSGIVKIVDANDRVYKTRLW